MARVIKNGNIQVTYSYKKHVDKCNAGQAWARGVDVVKDHYALEWVTAHTDGTIIKVVDYLDGTNKVLDKENMGYGNYVMIEHKDRLVTLYAHLEKVQVKEGQKVAKGTTLGFMGNTGGSSGAHLHFEVREYNEPITKANLHNTNAFNWLDAQAYIDIDLPVPTPTPTPTPTPKPVEEDLTKNTIPNRFKVKKDGKQIGAYTNYSLACNFANTVAGAIVVDSANNNKQVYPKEVVKEELTATSYPNYTDGSTYKVMTKYNNWSTSKGAYSVFANAYKQWKKYKESGYHLYDKNWKQLD